MWIRLSFAPLWVRILAFLALATLAAALFAAFTWYQDGTLPDYAIAMLIIGFGTAAVGSTVAVGQAKQLYGRVLDDIDLPATRTAALNAAIRGPIPADPVIRHIAAILAAIRAQAISQHARRQIIGGTGGAALLAALAVAATASGYPRQALPDGLLALWLGGTAAYTHWSRRHAIQRQQLLTGP